MKKISIMIPCYNEAENIPLLYPEIKKLFDNELKKYDYEIVLIDNKSLDNTREEIRKICKQDKKVKAIFNAHNFGQFNSPYHAILQTSGDCTITMCADFQDPVEMIPKFIEEWENGYKIVIGKKTRSKESKLMYLTRGLYYKLIKSYSEVEQIEQFTGFGLYDKAFVQVLRDLKDPTPYMRGIVAELGFERKEIHYEQPKRLHGKSSNNFMRLFDAAMLGFTSYTKKEIHIATIFGALMFFLNFIALFVLSIIKICCWETFHMGYIPVLLSVFLVGGMLLFVLGFIGEYIISINSRVMNRPLVVEEERINF